MLKRRAAPVKTSISRQHFVGGAFHGGNRLARAETGFGVAQNLDAGQCVEVLHGVWARHKTDLGYGADLHHLPGFGAHVQVANVIGLGSVLPFSLHQHLVDASVFIEVVDVIAAQSRGQGVVDIAHGYPHAAGFFGINTHKKLRRIGLPQRFNALQLRLLVGLFQQRRQQLRQTPHATVALVLKVKLKTTSLPQALDGRWAKGQWQALFDAAGFHVELAHQLLGRLIALTPGFERHEQGGGRRFQAAATQKVKPYQAEHGFDIFIAAHRRLHLLDDLVSTLQRRAFGQDHGGDVVALVFIRHQAARHHFEEQPCQHTHAHKQHQPHQAALQEKRHTLGVACR